MRAIRGPASVFNNPVLVGTVTILVVVGLIAWVLADYRAQQRDLADLEARGHGRKSGSSLGSKA